MFNASLYLIRQRLAVRVTYSLRYALATVRVFTLLGFALVAMAVSRPALAANGITNYSIGVWTGCGEGSGTDARVFIKMSGDLGYLGSQELDNRNRNDFERCQFDQFFLYGVRQVGRIKSVTVWHDNSGNRPGWFLNKLSIFDIETGQQTNFYPRQWLSLSDWPYETFIVLEPR